MTTLDPVAFFKAIADETRLKIVGLLAHEAHTVEEIAAMLALKPSTISHHLSRLADVGLVNARADGYYKLYRLETSRLETFADKFISTKALARFVEDVDRNAYARNVIAEYSSADGSLKTFPSQSRKRRVILRHLASKFDPKIHYKEDDVNRILTTYHEDAYMLRRELMASGFLKLEQGMYRCSTTAMHEPDP